MAKQIAVLIGSASKTSAADLLLNTYKKLHRQAFN